jgi:hypothetical protein
MKSFWICTCWLAAGLLSAVSIAAPALQGGSFEEAARSMDEGRRAELLERWRSMDDATRARMKARFDQLQSLPQEERQRALERGRRLIEELEATEEALDPEQRAVLDRLPARERRRVVRGLFGDEARGTAALLRRMLTEEERARLESLGPDERDAVVARLKRRAMDQAFKDISRIGRDLGLSTERLRSLRELPLEERRVALVAELRIRCREYVDEQGLPPGLTEDGWAHMESRSDEQFVRGLARTLRRDPSFGIPPERWEKLQRKRAGQARRLAALSEPSMQLRSERPELAGRALRQEALASRRAEAVAALAATGGLGDPERERLRSLSSEDLWSVYRSSLERLGRGLDGRSAVNQAMVTTSRRNGAERRRDSRGDAKGPGRSRSRR